MIANERPVLQRPECPRKKAGNVMKLIKAYFLIGRMTVLGVNHKRPGVSWRQSQMSYKPRVLLIWDAATRCELQLAAIM